MTIYQQIAANKRRTYLFMAFFVFLAVTLSYVFSLAGGYDLGFVFSIFLVSLTLTIVSFYTADQLVLAISHAQPADKKQYFDYVTVVENMAIAAGLPTPKTYIIDSPALNAFATGRDPKHGVVVATTGLISRLDRSQLEGVISHELSHIRNYDIRLMTLVAILAGSLALLADIFLRGSWRRSRSQERNSAGPILLIVGLFLALITPLLATLVKLAVSRKREYLADASGALLTRNPDALAEALTIISENSVALNSASPATAHLFFANPFKENQGLSWLTQLFNTHPPVAERIRRLRAM